MGQGVFLDVFGMVAEAVAVSQGGIALAIAFHEGTGEPHQGRLQGFIRQGLDHGSRKVMMFVPPIIVHG